MIVGDVDPTDLPELLQIRRRVVLGVLAAEPYVAALPAVVGALEPQLVGLGQGEEGAGAIVGGVDDVARHVVSDEGEEPGVLQGSRGGRLGGGTCRPFGGEIADVDAGEGEGHEHVS